MSEAGNLIWVFGIFAGLLGFSGLYCMLASFNLIRVLIGLELIIKAVTLLIILIGYSTNHLALTQSLVVTLIVVEVVMITIGMGLVLGIHRHNNSLDARNIRRLKG